MVFISLKFYQKLGISSADMVLDGFYFLLVFLLYMTGVQSGLVISSCEFNRCQFAELLTCYVFVMWHLRFGAYLKAFPPFSQLLIHFLRRQLCTNHTATGCFVPLRLSGMLMFVAAFAQRP